MCSTSDALIQFTLRVGGVAEEPFPPEPADAAWWTCESGATEQATHGLVKRGGGRWNPERRVWEPRYDQVVACGLIERIVNDEGI